MPNDTIVMCNPNQLYFGTDLLTDHINASILNLRDVTGDDVTRVIMQFSGGTQIVDAGSILPSLVQRLIITRRTRGAKGLPCIFTTSEIMACSLTLTGRSLPCRDALGV